MPCGERSSTSNADESLRSACISCTDLNNLVNVQSRMYHFRRKHVTNMTVSNPESQRRLPTVLTPALNSWVHHSNATKKEASRVPQFFVFGLKGWPAAQNNQPSTEHILPAERLHWQHRNPRLFARLLQLRKPLARNNCRDRVRKVKENSIKLNWKKHFKNSDHKETHFHSVWPRLHLQSDWSAPVHEAQFETSTSVTYQGCNGSRSSECWDHVLGKRDKIL